jgi:hypothetical protein
VDARGHNLLKLRQHIPLQRLGLRRCLQANLLQRLVLRSQERLRLRKVPQPHPLRTLRKDEEALVRHLHHLVDGRARPDQVQVRTLRHILAGVALGDDENRLLLAQRLNQLDGALAAHRQRQHRMGEKHRIPHGRIGYERP